MTYFQSLSAAGFAATALSYGPARMGFGLFVPEFRSAFSMSSSAVGIVSSLGFLGFFFGLVVAQILLNRRGPEAPVLLGIGVAISGMAIVALAPNLYVLALGVFLASSSAGFAWTPFNDAVHRKVDDLDRPTALSEISTGTSIGIAFAGLAAIAMVVSGIDWRYCWAGFALIGAVILYFNWFALEPVEKAVDPKVRPGWRDVVHPTAFPLFLIAFVFGVTSAIFISFAPDRFSKSGEALGITGTIAPGLVFILYGLFGLAGLLTQRVKGMIGLPWLLRFLMLTSASSLAIVALFPGSWAGLVAAAGLQGINVMMTSAVLAFWSERLFPRLPALSFTATLLATALGSVVGPAIAGLVLDAYGAEAMFLGTAGLPALVLIAIWNRYVRERPAMTA